MATQTTGTRSPHGMLAGQLIHAALGTLLATADARPGALADDAWCTHVMATCDDLVDSVPRLASHRARLRVAVTTAVGAYLHQWAPPNSVTFLGAEVVAGRGFVDLAWSDPRAGVFFDEIKTTRLPDPGRNAAYLAQTRRYAVEGERLFGNRFAGVRLVPVLAPTSAMLVTSSTATRLAQTRLAPATLNAGVL